MISGWAAAIAILVILLLAGLYVIGMRIMTQNDIIIKAIPFGSPKILERRVPPQAEARETRPVGSTARHGNGQ